MAELPLWVHFNKVSRLYVDAMAARLGHLGIRRNFFLLVAIGEGKGALTQQQLADLLEMDKVAMVGILDTLAEAGFIRRTQSPADRRKHLIVLTPKARKALPEIRRSIRELNLRTLSRLPPALAADFQSALLSMRTELKAVIEETESAGKAVGAPAARKRSTPAA